MGKTNFFNSIEAGKVAATVPEANNGQPALTLRENFGLPGSQLYCSVFLPPPFATYGPTFYVEDVIDVDGLSADCPCDPEYGSLVSGSALKTALRAAGFSIGRSRLRGHDRRRLVQERLDMAELLRSYGCEVFTASNDVEWLNLASVRGVIATHVDQQQYAVENIAGLSALDLWTVHFQRADGTHVCLVEHGVSAAAVGERLDRIGVRRHGEQWIVLNAPDRMIPWEIPARGDRKLTQLSNWIDYGFNVWSDSDSRPHLVIGEAVIRVADIQCRRQELELFLTAAATHFEGFHILELAEGCRYGAPTNSIDVGTAILSNASLWCRNRMEGILRRSIDNSMHFEENPPGFRCAVFPVDRSAYSLLAEGDPLHHASVDRSQIDPLDPMDIFFDIHGQEHERLAARLSARREQLGEAPHSQDDECRPDSPLHLCSGLE